MKVLTPAKWTVPEIVVRDGLVYRFGVIEFDDGWNIAMDRAGDFGVYEPTFPTEAEATALCQTLRDRIHKRVVTEGYAR